MKLTPQYIAGFIDGEGYLGIIKKMSPRDTLGYYYTPCLKISQVTRNDKVLEMIKDYFGYGNVTKDKRNVSSDNAVNKTSLEFRSMKRVTPILEEILPYLIVKKEQAKVLLEFSKIPQIKDSYSRREEIDRKRTILYTEIRYLNRKGLAETERKEADKAKQQSELHE